MTLIKRFSVFLLFILLCITALPVTVYGQELFEPATWTIQGINTECTIAKMIAYTGTGTSGTSEKCVDVCISSEGIVLSVGGNNQEIPENGFVLSGAGNKRTLINTLSVGDGVFLNEDSLEVIVVPKDYTPYKTTEITYGSTNGVRNQDKIVLYNTYNSTETTGTNTWGTEVCINADGFVISIGGNNNQIPEGGFVLSGNGAGKTSLEENVQLGMKAEWDPTHHKVTFTYDDESCIFAYKQKVSDIQTAYENALAAYLVLDEQEIEEQTVSLQNSLQQIQKAIEQKNYLQFYADSVQFDNQYQHAESLLTETAPVETRGVWLRPEISKSKDQVYSTVKSIYEAGFNQVYLEILFDNTWICPTPEGSYYEQNPSLSGVDLLRWYVDACHSYRIEIYAWYSTCRVGYKGSSNTTKNVGAKKPEWLNISKNGLDYVSNSYGDAYFLNPALPEVRQFLVESIQYLAENYELDGIQLDYIRYPNNETGEDFGYDSYTCEEFKKVYQTDPHDLTAGTSEYLEFCQFRADYVTQLVSEIREMLNTVRPDMYLGAAVAPGYSDTVSTMQQDSVKWIEENLIDIVFPMAYGTTDAVKEYISENQNAAEDHTYVFVGVADYGAETFSEQTMATRNGADGVAFFSWSTYTSEYRSYMADTFSQKAVSPTANAKQAMIAQLQLIQKRLQGPMKDLSVQSLEETTEQLITLLETNSLSDASKAIKNYMKTATLTISNLPENAASVLESDLLTISKLTNLCKDDAREKYTTEHPLPESLIVSEESASQEESSDVSTEESTSETTSVFDQIMMVLFIIVLFIGIGGIPLYYVLLSRRRKLLRDYQEQKDNQNSDESSVQDLDSVTEDSDSSSDSENQKDSPSGKE